LLCLGPARHARFTLHTLRRTPAFTLITLLLLTLGMVQGSELLKPGASVQQL